MFDQATPELMIEAYRQGIFPMADSADSTHYNFYRPEMRGQLSINDLHIPKKLFKTVKKNPYRLSVDEAFKDVVTGCADIAKGRDSTWINQTIRDVFVDLHEAGHAHSVECWDDDNQLVGGLYGLSIGSVFCGESMFSRATDASKVALVYLCARLSYGGFTVLDTQFTNEHLEQFGIYEIPQDEYEELIKTEMNKPADFNLSSKSYDEIMNYYFGKVRKS